MDYRTFYLSCQRKIATEEGFRRFWEFCGIYSLLFLLASMVWFSFAYDWQITAFVFLVFILVRGIISPLIFLFYKKSRPYQRLGFVPIQNIYLLSGVTKRQNSFPSDHAGSFSAISMSVYFFFPALGIVLFILTVLNGLGRVVLGYHDIWDILAGWFLGISTALILSYWVIPMLFTR